MLTLYDFMPSGNGYRVRLTLLELGLRFRLQQVDLLRGETRQPWFLAKNPMGQIPVLELEDGRCLSESTAILFHLARGSALLPQTAVEQDEVLRWLCFEQTNVDGVISRARFRKLFPAVIPTRTEEFESWWRDGHRALQVLNDHLERHPFLVADRYSIADIALYSYVHVAHEGGFDLSAHEALKAWCGRIEARPAYLPISSMPSEFEAPRVDVDSVRAVDSVSDAIRPLQADEANDVALLWQEVFGYDEARNDPGLVIADKLRWDARHASGGVLVARDDSGLFASIMFGYDGHRGWLYRLAVSSALRRQGWGRRLVIAAEARLREWGCRKINVQTHSQNEAGAAFWESVGYTREARTSLGKALFE